MKQKDILFLLISTFIIVILWVIFSVYHNYILSTISEPIQMQIVPISPNFDTKAIDKLKKREKISPSYTIENTQVSISPSPSPIASSTPTPVPVANFSVPATNLSASEEAQRRLQLMLGTQ